MRKNLKATNSAQIEILSCPLSKATGNTPQKLHKEYGIRQSLYQFLFTSVEDNMF
jgi:hypothetical protein